MTDQYDPLGLKIRAGLSGKGTCFKKFLPPDAKLYAAVSIEYSVQPGSRRRVAHHMIYQWSWNDEDLWVGLAIKRYPNEKDRPDQTWKIKETQLGLWYYGIYKERIDRRPMANIVVDKLVINREVPPEVEDTIKAIRFCEHLDKG